MPPFRLETLCDFPDDAASTPVTLTPRHLDALMKALASRGIGRVIWGYYGDGRGGLLIPAGIAGMVRGLGLSTDQNLWDAYGRTLDALSNPLRAATEAAHRHGLELYAYFKPYETGPAMYLAEGSPEAREWGRLPHLGGFLTWLDPFVLANPHLRLQRRTDDLWPGHAEAPIRSLRLTKRDDAPTRITADRLQLWTSDLNYGYRRASPRFAFSERVEPSPREVRDVYGNVLTRRGDPVRVLELTGLDLRDRCVAVATDFADGPGDFENAWDRLLTAYDERGREIPGVFATGTGIWFPELEEFPRRGLYFDTGRGPEAVTLDAPREGTGDGPPSQRHFQPGQKKVRGCLGFMRGRNAFLPGGLCETEPAVQAFWLGCLREMLDAGVDGVEVRVENHSCHTDTPEDYGFNPAVLARVERGGGGNGAFAERVARVRTAAYTEFLRRAKATVNAAGKPLRVNLNVDWFRPAEERPGSRRLAYPANLEFDWRAWIAEGLLNEAMLRVFAKPFDGLFGDDPTARAMVEACRGRGIPVAVNRYVWANAGLADELERVRADGRFDGFVFYETWSYTAVGEDGSWDLATEGGQAPEPERAVAATRAATAGYVREALEKHRRPKSSG